MISLKSNWLKKLVSASALTGALFLGNAVEAGIVTDRFPIQMYVDHQLDTYTHAGDSRRAGWADANTDLIRVYSVSNGWARVSHPGRGGTVNRYCRVNELFADPNYSNRTARVKGAQSAYRTSSGSATIGSVSNNEEVTVLADNGSRAQIIYRLDNGSGYKVGWVPSSSVQGGASSGGASSKGNGDVDGDGQVTKSDVDMLLAYIQGKRGDLPRRDNADLNGDGSIDIFDVTAVNNILRNSATQTRPSQSNVSTVNSQRVITNNTISVRTAGIANGWYKIHPAHDMGRALDALGVATSNGNNLHMWSNANVPQQKFYLENRGNNWFTLRTGYGSGLYVTAVGSGNGANLEMKPWSGFPSQMFQLVNGGNVNGKTVYHIMARVGSNLNFDCAGGGRSDGNNAQLWTKETGSSWHKWYFEPVSANSGNTIPTPQTKTAWINTQSQSLNMRAGAGQNYGIIGKLAKGTQVTVLEELSNGWSKISSSAGTGYVSSQYLTYVKTGSNNGGGNTSYNETQVINRITQLYTTSGYRLNTKYSGAGQCRGFANKVYQTLFAVGYVGGYTGDNFGASTYPSSYSVGSIRNFASNDVNSVKMLFGKAKPGAFIQMGRRYRLNSSKSAASPHSAILVATDDNGATFYEANTDGKKYN